MTDTALLLILGTVLSGVAVWLIVGIVRRSRLLPGSCLARWIVSRRRPSKRGASEPDMLHLKGVTITQLRPSGAAFINGKRVDVIAEGTLIDRGASVEVVAVEGLRVVVREV